MTFLNLFKGSSGNDPLPIGSSSSSSTTNSSMNEIADVDVYFKRLYSKTNNPPPISVDEFLDIMTRCKDSQIQREKVRQTIDLSMKISVCVFFLLPRMFFTME